ncbi:MAG TPA: four helix bundle protein [Acidimicrobiia bacterium]
MHDFRRLEIWQDGIALAAHIYAITAQLPKSERYGLTTQIRRAAASVPSNIAEGAGRGGRKEMARFLQIALGSLSEMESHLVMAVTLEFLADEDLPVETIRSLRNRILRLHDQLTGARP